MDFSSDPFYISYITDLAFLQHFHCYFFPRERVYTHLNFSEGAFSEVPGEDIVADGPASLQGRLCFPLSHE